MKYIYAIETKSFFKNANGIDYQVADLGTLPMLFGNFKKAVMMMQRKRDTHTQLFGEILTKDYTADELTEPFVMDKFETVGPTDGTRTIVTLYKIIMN